MSRPDIIRIVTRLWTSRGEIRTTGIRRRWIQKFVMTVVKLPAFAACTEGFEQVELTSADRLKWILGDASVTTSTSSLTRSTKYSGRPRRGLLPISGVMILFSVLMFGLALAIPASRAIQEAEMRDRLAGIAATTVDEEETTESESDWTSGIPSTDDRRLASTTGGGSAPPPSPIELDDLDQETDRANTLEALRDNVQNHREEGEDSRAPKPAHIRVPDLGIDAEIHQVGYEIKEIEGQRVREWDVASYAAGHHKTSARPGEGGNVVVTGHNDWEGEVFRTLEYAEYGQIVEIETEEGIHNYEIREVHMRQEIGASLEERLETGRFMAEMPEERLTLITCWPYGINDHRVIVVAVPVD